MAAPDLSKSSSVCRTFLSKARARGHGSKMVRGPVAARRAALGAGALGLTDGARGRARPARLCALQAKVKAHEIRTKPKADLQKQLEELKTELGQLRVAKVTGGAASKLSKMYARDARTRTLPPARPLFAVPRLLSRAPPRRPAETRAPARRASAEWALTVPTRTRAGCR